MKKTSIVSIRMDAEVKEAGDKLFEQLGLTMSSAVNMFVRQALREGGIPFRVALGEPNRETVDALIEANEIARHPEIRGYNNPAELFAVLNEDDTEA